MSHTKSMVANMMLTTSSENSTFTVSGKKKMEKIEKNHNMIEYVEFFTIVLFFSLYVPVQGVVILFSVTFPAH